MQSSFHHKLPSPQVVAGTLIGVALSFVLGWYAGNGGFKEIQIVIYSIAALTIAFQFKQKVWLLIPLMSQFPLRMPLSMPFKFQELIILGVFGMFLAFYAMKVPLYRQKFDYLDVVMLLNLGYLFTVYLRNPTGLYRLGSEIVGGRRYFTLAVFCLAYMVITRVRVGPKLGFWMPLLISIMPLTRYALQYISWRIPFLAFILNPIVGGLGPQVNDMGEVLERVTPGQDLGKTIIPLLLCYYQPLTLCIPYYIGRFTLFAGSLFALLTSGFRSSLFHMGLMFFIAAFLWNRMQGVTRSLGLAFIGFLGLIVIQNWGVMELPGTFQRAMVFIPGIKWSADARFQANNSDNWRQEMWDEVWESDRWIRNRMLGDGFGFPRSDLLLMAGDDAQGFIGLNDPTIAQKITGAFHNGPLTAIRFVGYIGLILYTFLMLTMIKYSMELYRDAKGGPFQPASIFVVCQTISYPFIFFLVFGSYDHEIADMVYLIAYMRLYRNSLDDYRVSQGLPARTKVRSKADPATPAEFVTPPKKPTSVPMAFRNLPEYKPSQKVRPRGVRG